MDSTPAKWGDQPAQPIVNEPAQPSLQQPVEPSMKESSQPNVKKFRQPKGKESGKSNVTVRNLMQPDEGFIPDELVKAPRPGWDQKNTANDGWECAPQNWDTGTERAENHMDWTTKDNSAMLTSLDNSAGSTITTSSVVPPTPTKSNVEEAGSAITKSSVVPLTLTKSNVKEEGNEDSGEEDWEAAWGFDELPI